MDCISYRIYYIWSDFILTDGIIQKVFGKYYQLTAREREIQQELIEEIKKLRMTDDYGEYVIDLKELIGDNE